MRFIALQFYLNHNSNEMHILHIPGQLFWSYIQVEHGSTWPYLFILFM